MRIVIAIPALNEEKVLRPTVETLQRFLSAGLSGHEATIVIADNGSDDATGEIGRLLERELPGVRYLRIDRRGKGLAIRTVWSAADADAYVFMDADLATDLSALPELIDEIAGGAGMAIGSRFHRGSVVSRGIFRQMLSHGYRLFLRGALSTSIHDAPCGFKAASAAVVRDVMPSVVNDRWFFDTELVVRAERAGYGIAEVPVVWRETKPLGRSSRVNVPALVLEYVRHVLRLRRDLGKG
jgi:glycosyltransferase involved in cell wall biosynthesis